MIQRVWAAQATTAASIIRVAFFIFVSLHRSQRKTKKKLSMPRFAAGDRLRHLAFAADNERIGDTPRLRPVRPEAVRLPVPLACGLPIADTLVIGPQTTVGFRQFGARDHVFGHCGSSL